MFGVDSKLNSFLLQYDQSDDSLLLNKKWYLTF